MPKQTNTTGNAHDAIRNLIREEIKSALPGMVEDAVVRILTQGGKANAAVNIPGIPTVVVPTGAKPKGKRRKNVVTPAGKVPAEKRCHVVGCNNERRSKGYCAKHYQAARNKKWAMPAPESYTPPAS